MAIANNKIKILTWNAHGISNKIIELYDYMTNQNIQVACINETFLKSHINLHCHPNYQCHRFDRTDRLKGGVAILVDRNIIHTLLPALNTQLLETIGIEITSVKNTKIRIIAAYLPGGSSNTLINQHLINDIRLLMQCQVSYFIVGDLNTKHRFWNCARANRAGTLLYNEFCLKNFLILFPATPTHIPNCHQQTAFGSNFYDLNVSSTSQE